MLKLYPEIVDKKTGETQYHKHKIFFKVCNYLRHSETTCTTLVLWVCKLTRLSITYPTLLQLLHHTHRFCEGNAKYQLHKLLRAISHPLYAKERVFPIREEDTAIEAMLLNMSPHQFSMFVKMAFVNSYRVDCNLVNCINNCNRVSYWMWLTHCSLLMITDCLHFPLQRRVMPWLAYVYYLATYVFNGTNKILIVHII